MTFQWPFLNFNDLNQHFRNARVCLIMVSRDRSPENFFALQKVRTEIITKMIKKKLFDELAKPDQGGYPVAEIGIADLEHFLYFW